MPNEEIEKVNSETNGSWDVIPIIDTKPTHDIGIICKEIDSEGYAERFTYIVKMGEVHYRFILSLTIKEDGLYEVDLHTFEHDDKLLELDKSIKKRLLATFRSFLNSINMENHVVKIIYGQISRNSHVSNRPLKRNYKKHSESEIYRGARRIFYTGAIEIIPELEPWQEMNTPYHIYAKVSQPEIEN